MRRVGPAVFLGAVLLAGCTNTNSASDARPAATAGGSTTAPAAARTTSPDDPLAGVKVPDNFTPLTLTPISSPTFPFRGTDEKYHVVYDLQMVNASKLPATLEKVDVVDASDPETVVASFSGSQLVAADCFPGTDCGRLRLLPSAPTDDATIPPQAGRALLVDFTVDSPEDAPKAVLHHIYATGASGPGAQQPTKIDYVVAPFDISAGAPRVIGPPVKGDNWIALNGCCLPGWPHRPSLNALNGQIRNSQRFALDWKQVNAAGEFTSGDKTQNESYVDYGAEIYAVDDGTVVSILDDQDANDPGVLPASVPELAAKLTVENVDGNHIVLDIGGGAYAMYAHLEKGSLKVKPGAKVKKGDVIARLGNTGNSNASHMHFQLMDGPSLFEADALPYVIDRFVYRGQVDPQRIVDADDYLSGNFLPAGLPKGEERKDELPLALAIVDFPKD